MNILLPYSEIKKFLETDATAEEFQRYLSLCGPSIERIEKKGTDAVFDNEVTTNRIDYASVVGIIQEASAILPNFGKKAVIKQNLLQDFHFDQLTFTKKPMLKVSRNSDLNPRFTACVLDNVLVHPSSQEMQDFLQKCGIRSINNVVDISNYLMLLFGQPVHIFDYDRIKAGVMRLRESQDWP
jgi:phenylalanyl-tRNA synthetase beta chain